MDQASQRPLRAVQLGWGNTEDGWGNAVDNWVNGNGSKMPSGLSKLVKSQRKANPCQVTYINGYLMMCLPLSASQGTDLQKRRLW